MSKKIDIFQNELEWESFAWPTEISHLSSIQNYYKIPSDALVSIERSEEFDLIGSISGTVESQEDLNYKIDGKNPQSGEMVKGDLIKGYDSAGNLEFDLNNFFIGNTTFKFSSKSGVIRNHFTAKISIESIEQKFSADARNLDSLLEFYLTGKIGILFPRSTDRAKNIKYEKSRHGIDPKEDEPVMISSKSHGGARDFLYVETEDFNFIVQLVDKSFLPIWGNGIQIEYRNSFKKLPDKQTREAISEIVGFVFGTQLLKIGETHLDSNLNVVLRSANNPWGDNVVSKCDSTSLPPMNFKDYEDWNKLERVLNKLVPKYLELRKQLGLSDTLWKYWISKELAIGTNLPILSSALEGLVEKYLSFKSTIKKYDKKQKKDYTTLVQDEVHSLTQKLSEYQFSDRIINQLKNPFNVGMGEKINLFFNEIEIFLSKDSVENEALKARNKMTHSSIGSTDEEIKKYSKLSRAYQTLVNRTILKVLEYDEDYIDYYSIGHPNRHIDENINTPNKH